MTPLKPNAMKSMQIIRNAVRLLSLLRWGRFFDSSHAQHRILARGKGICRGESGHDDSPHRNRGPSGRNAFQPYARRVLCKGRDDYPLVSRYGLIQQSEQYSLSNANKGYLPRFPSRPKRLTRPT